MHGHRTAASNLPALDGGAHRIPGLPSHNPTVNNTNHLALAPSRVVLPMAV